MYTHWLNVTHQIWRNGLVTFGVLSSQANVTVPTRNYSEIDAEYLLAPLWFPNISTSLLNSTVSWEVEELTETDEDDEGSGSGSVDEESLLQFAEDTVYNYTTRNFGTPSDFSPTWAIVINWNVSLLPYYETHNICLAFYECQCRNFNEDYGSSNGYGSGPCRTEECYGVYGWSDNDIHYLDLICDLYISDIAVSILFASTLLYMHLFPPSSLLLTYTSLSLIMSPFFTQPLYNITLMLAI